MTRLFVAIDLPDPLKTEVSELVAYGMPGVAWVDSKQLHLSLRFIGEVDEQVFEQLRTCLLKVHQQSFNLKLRGVGTFPQGKSPRVIWVGMEKSDPLVQLRNKIEHQINSIGIKGEQRKFHPHVTLGRVKSNKIKRMGDYLAHYDLFRSEPFSVDCFSLFSSLLTSSGAKHTKEAEYSLR